MADIGNRNQQLYLIFSTTGRYKLWLFSGFYFIIQQQKGLMCFDPFDSEQKGFDVILYSSATAGKLAGTEGMVIT